MDDLVVHVPVDTIEIVNGPGTVLSMQLMELLSGTLNRLEYVIQEFTLKTAASMSTFRRTLKIYTIFNVKSDGTYDFTAIFSGRIVSGSYNPRTRKGYFSLD